MDPARVSALLFVAACFAGPTSSSAQVSLKPDPLTVETKQHFPADLPIADRRTQWRVIWGVENHDAGAETLVIRGAWFSRKPNDPEVQVLGDVRLAEIFVPYYNGTGIFDISNHPGFKLADLTKDALGPTCLGLGRIFDRNGKSAAKGPVAVEVHDDHVRWMNTRDRVRRAHKLQIWGALSAENYRYIMLYEFNDDGSICVRLGATASNLLESNDDFTTHFHSGLWRINFELDDPAALKVSVVERKPKLLKTAIRPLATEADLIFKPKKFTRLRVESNRFKNNHDEPHFIGYELHPRLAGTGRFHRQDEKFTRSDFWVTRRNPQELKPRELPTYNNNESLKNVPVTIWHMAGVMHVARDEDFGPVGTHPDQGLAIISWVGFDLKPRNFFASTPLYP